MNILFGTIGLFLAVMAYLLPSIIASSRKHPNANSICVINIFFGWTLLGWVICLAWSVSGSGQSNQSGEPSRLGKLMESRRVEL